MRMKSRKTGRRILLGMIGFLFVASVPWYRQGGEFQLFLGLPDWVAVAIGCYAVAACLNSWAWLWTEVDDHAELDFLPKSNDQAEEKGS